MPGLDPETLEKLRRGFPLRMDHRGDFFLADDPITHPGVVAAFRRGLDLAESGEPIVRFGEQWTYLGVADCVLRVLRVVADEAGRPMLVLDDGRTVALDAESLWEEPGRGLRCTAPSVANARPLSARFGNTAQMDLDRWIEWPNGMDARPWLRMPDGGVGSPIPDAAPAEATLTPPE
jgi:hypothetical protein